MTDDWTGPRGERIVPHDGVWRLISAPLCTRIRGSHRRPVFEGTRDECLGFAAYVVEHDRSYGEWLDTEMSVVSEFGDFDLRATKRPGQAVARATATERATGRVVGRFDFNHTRLEGCYVCREMVIDGSPRVDDAFQRRGIATAMRGLAEKASGMRSVPHGYAMIGGVQTDAAKAMWASRRFTHDVPAFEGAEAERRERFLWERQRAVRTEAKFFLHSAFAVQLAERLGGEVVVAEIGSARLSWCDIDGRIATCSGYLDAADLRAHVVERFGPVVEFEPRPATAQERFDFMRPAAFFPDQSPGAKPEELDAICARYFEREPEMTP